MRLTRFLAVLVLSFSLFACSNKDQMETPAVASSRTAIPEISTRSTAEEPRHDERLIVALGDSLTAGFGVRAEDSYPSLLQRRLDRLEIPYRVMNAGVTGDTTSGGLRRIDVILQSRPDLVLLELGGNDGLRGMPLDLIERNLESIIRRLQSEKIPVVLMGMRLPPNYGEDYTDGFHEIYTGLSRKYEIPLVPFFLDGVAAKPELNQEDGIHPNAEGYRIIEERLWPVLEPMIEDSAQQENGSPRA
jgi:acyl-CoA thioesterase-1